METHRVKNKLKGRLFNLVMVLLFISGAAVVLYPAVSDLWNSQWNNRMKSIYDKSVNLYSEDTLKDE